MSVNDEQPDLRLRAAAEVVELGEALFDSLLETVARPAAEAEPFPVEEVSDAARQFFTALRLLLKLETP
jgi:hypothetical protein